MLKQFFAPIIATLIFGISGTVVAIPTLQLDIEGGYYDSANEDMVSESPQFNLYAYGNSNGTTGGGGTTTEFDMLNTTYYLSIALTPTVDSALDLGSIDINGSTYSATSDFTYGTPPFSATANPDLTHGGYFDTYYLELAFNFDAAMTASLVNTETDGGLTPDTSGTDMFFIPFLIDMTNLAGGYNLHFDLYTTADRNGEIIRGDFAPYSHDASTNVPEPASLALFSIGLLGLGVISRRKKLNQA